MAKTIGIDLGTTCSCVAYAEAGHVRVLHNKFGHATTPSLVALTQAGKLLVGHQAKRQALTNPGGTVNGVKRLIGRTFSSPDAQHALAQANYRAVAGPNDSLRLLLGDTAFTPVEITAQILLNLRQTAEHNLKEPVTQAVVSVPVHFDAAQRQATVQAATLAGLQAVELLAEPVATALAYSENTPLPAKVAVFDLGGGALDVSLLQAWTGESGGVHSVVATAGDRFLGGDLFDERIVDYLVESFFRAHSSSLRGDSMAMQRLREAAEKAKMELSTATSTEISLPFIQTLPANAADATPARRLPSDARHVQATLSRQQYSGMVSDLLRRSIDLCQEALRKVGWQPSEVGAVLLVGGMSRTPLVRAEVEWLFGRPPCLAAQSDEAVACGAALQGLTHFHPSQKVSG
jgi:molecular chaperone DnaK